MMSLEPYLCHFPYSFPYSQSQFQPSIGQGRRYGFPNPHMYARQQRARAYTNQNASNPNPFLMLFQFVPLVLIFLVPLLFQGASHEEAFRFVLAFCHWLCVCDWLCVCGLKSDLRCIGSSSISFGHTPSLHQTSEFSIARTTSSGIEYFVSNSFSRRYGRDPRSIYYVEQQVEQVCVD